VVAVALVVAIIVTVASLVMFQNGPEKAGGPLGKPSGRSALPPPWPLPVDVQANVEAAGLDLGPMGMAEHYHPELRLVINGEDVPVPAGVGIDPATGAMSALHTHTSDGVLHVEADEAGQTFTLGQLFTQWGVPLTRSAVSGMRGQVEVTVNGDPFDGDPVKLALAPNQEVVLSLNTN
jgi:hypothetical protein